MTPLMFALRTEHKSYCNPTTGMYMNNTAIVDDVLIVSNSAEDSKKALAVVI